MGPFAVHIFGVFAILAMAWALFFLWLIGLVARGIWMGFSRLVGFSHQPRRLMTMSRRCTRLRCLSENPPQANFCRRCGSPLARPLVGGRRSATARSGRWVSSPSHL